MQRYEGYNAYLRYKLRICHQPAPTTIDSFTRSTTDPKYIEQVKSAIQKILPSNHDDGSLAPVILRLAWHACATYDSQTKIGGSNGATMRFIPEINDEGNMGLEIARAALEPIKQKFSKITYSDLWTLAGKVAIESLGGPYIPWFPGRYDCLDTKYVPPAGLLPFGDKAANHIRTTFTRLGFSDQETVALIGAHNLGRCHKHISGWEGKWTREPLQFSSEFFKALVHESWHQGEVPETGKTQYYNEDGTLMMLNTDMELIRDPSYRTWVMEYAKDEEKFFVDFSKAFAKLLELGIERDEYGNVIFKKNL
ncbi:CCP2 [Candida oxycetoniae]|uniref:Peroxidase n=1 Tax=Candida oxycetoniae TaxID=497107 RepID=A0AAI9SVQ3_9ASCO|nr:CCP2 [Candida oxycetoniae]KAI3403571.2 CCP2 [Candida oxycetoniae]